MNFLKQVIHRIKTSLFLRNVATLTSGTTLAQAISIFTAPVLYRIYEKDDYGTLGLYMAIVGIIGVFSTLQYNHAILLEKEDDDAKIVMWLNRVINTGVALLTLVFVFFLGDFIGESLGNESVTNWLYLAPISIFFSGQGKIFSVWANRKKKYRILTLNAILTALSVPAVSISIGVFNNGPLGLFMGLIVSHTLPSLILLLSLSRNENFGLKFLNYSKMKTFAKSYKKFPIYSLPATFVNDFSHNLPVLLFSKYFGAEVVAFYSLARRMLGIPTSLISNAVARVYREKITSLYNETGTIKRFYLKTLKSLVIISIIIFGLTILFVPFVFPLLFGKEWNEAILVTQIMSVVFILRFINSPISFIIFIKEKHQIDLIASVYFVLSTLGSFLVSNYFDFNYIQTLWVYVLNFASIYLIMMLYNHKLSIEKQ